MRGRQVAARKPRGFDPFAWTAAPGSTLALAVGFALVAAMLFGLELAIPREADVVPLAGGWLALGAAAAGAGLLGGALWRTLFARPGDHYREDGGDDDRP
jgi:hypothetical protein